MQSGARTSVAIAQRYLARMDAIDRAGPAINSIIERNPDALAIAEALDRERRDKGPRGPLHGIPVVLKDNIDTADRMRTSAGRLRSRRSIAARDAFIVERLRAAGCVILAKTNLSEWANFRGKRSTSGWSAPRRADAQPVRARSQHQRVELGLGRGNHGQPLRRCRRHRNRRLDREPVVDLRTGRHQAHGRPREPRRHHPDRA